MKHLRIKALVSSLLLLIFLLLSTSGAMLHFGKTGLILGFSRAFILKLHLGCSMSMLALIIGHVALNFRLYRQELKKLFSPRDD